MASLSSLLLHPGWSISAGDQLLHMKAADEGKIVRTYMKIKTDQKSTLIQKGENTGEKWEKGVSSKKTQHDIR